MKNTCITYKIEDFNPEPEPQKAQILPFNQYLQYVQSVFVVLFKPVLNSVSLVMCYMCTI